MLSLLLLLQRVRRGGGGGGRVFRSDDRFEVVRGFGCVFSPDVSVDCMEDGAIFSDCNVKVGFESSGMIWSLLESLLRSEGVSDREPGLEGVDSVVSTVDWDTGGWVELGFERVDLERLI